MINDWQLIPSAGQYEDALSDFLIRVETVTHTSPDYAAYLDSRGFLSIGVGFNLTTSSVHDAVYAALGLVQNDPQLSGNAQLQATENGYIAQLNAAIANQDADAFNEVLATRAANTGLTAVLGPLPTALTDTTVADVFEAIIGNYESLVDKWLPGIPDSNERIALVSLAYNSKVDAHGIPKTLGSGLLAAVESGNRADAWFQIRYKTNPAAADSAGIAKRRYYESQVFGLYADQNNPTPTEVLQAYQMLTANRATILQYEHKYGDNPDDATPGTHNEVAAANHDYGLSGSAQVQSLMEIFEPAAISEIDKLNSQYPDIVSISLDETGVMSPGSFTVRSVDIYAASPNHQIVDVRSNTDSNDHILLGNEPGDTLIGGQGNDILVAQGGDETLRSGNGADTLIASSGSDTLVLNGTADSLVFNLPGPTPFKETVIVNNLSVAGSISVGGSAIGADLVSTGDDSWTDSSGNQYDFIRSPSGAPLGYSPPSVLPDVGELQIFVGGQGGNEIDIWGFNLQAAETENGFLGISMPERLTLFAGANAGVDPPTPAFSAGSSQDYTVSLDAPQSVPQTVTVTLSGAPPSDFGLMGASDSAIESLNADGTFTVTIAPGETSASFSLANLADVGSDATLQLTATLSDPNSSGTPLASSQTLTQNFVEPALDPFTEPTAGGRNQVIDGAAGNDTILSEFDENQVGNSVDVLNGNGGQDILIDAATRIGTSVRVYADTEVDLATAIQNANGAYTGGQKGDLIASGNSFVTLVGGSGDDLIAAGYDAVMIAGTGNDSFVGGTNVGDVVEGTLGFPNTKWFASVNGYQLTVGGDYRLFSNGTDTTVGSEGTTDQYGVRLADSNNTVFGGSGSDYIELSNGENEVHLGNGAATVLGGAGDNTIFGGAGQANIQAGGGSDYIEAGTGDSLIVGRGGNNTVFGGAGNDTIFAGGDGTGFASEESGDDYVQAGSGNTLIFGSNGHDTLIGGAGEDTIYAGSGDEYIVGGSGDISINGGAGADTIDAGGDGADSILAGTGNATIYGGDGVDSLYGGAGADLIYAGDGGDESAATQVFAGSGDTTINGGDGVDRIWGGTGSNVIYAGDGGTGAAVTQIVAGSGDTTVYGGDGVEHIFGGSGTDVLYAGDGGTSDAPTYVIAGGGVASLYGGAGTDVLSDTVGGADLLMGGLGDETLVGVGNDTLVAGSGSDYLTGTDNTTFELGTDSGDVEIDATSGSHNLIFDSSISIDDLTITADLTSAGTPSLIIDDDSGSVTVDGGLDPNDLASVSFAGSDTLSLRQLLQQVGAAGGGVSVTVAGSQGNLVFNASSGNFITAGTGADTISDWGDNDTLTAGSGGDLIDAQGSGALVQGGSGTDTISGWGDNDTLTAGSGADLIDARGANGLVYGGSGNDTLDALGAGTTLVGGSGNTLFDIDDASDVVQVAPGTGYDTIASTVDYTLPANVDVLTLLGSSDLIGTGNADQYNQITGNGGNDTLIAGSGNDTLTAGAGNTRLVAGSGSDLLQAGTGTDTLVAGSGTATLQGGAGDTYLFDTGFGQDEIEQSTGLGTVQFGSGITPQDLTLTLTTGGNGLPALEIQDGTGSIKIDNGLNGAISEYDFADGSKLDFNALLSQAHVQPTTVAGALGNLVLDADAAASIMGGSGNDSIYGTGANDTLVAGSGTQQLLYGANSGDILVGGSGSDSLYGGVGDDTFMGGTGSTAMYGGEGNDSYMLTQGGSATIVPGASPGDEVIYLPAGMSFSDFSAFAGPSGDLILESGDAQTSLTISGFYNSGSTGKRWFIASDNDAPQPLAQWAASQSHPASDYTSEINQLRVAYAAHLDSELQDLGSQQYTLDLSTGYPNWNTYTFTGVTHQNLTVQNGALIVDSSDNLDIESTTTTVQTTYQISSPVYSTVTVPGSTHLLPADEIPQGGISYPSDFNVSAVYGPPGSANDPNDPNAAAFLGDDVTTPSTTRVVQTGTHVTTVTVPVSTTVTTATQGFTDYNITGDGGDDVLGLGSIGAPVVGTLITGDGNVAVNFDAANATQGPLGPSGFVTDFPSFQDYFANSVPKNETAVPGMFIQAGAGNDTIIGTGGADVIAAGTGFDYIEGYMGSTYYVPMQGDSTEVIGDPGEPYGGGPFPLNTLVLPTGITPQNLQYRLFTDPVSGAQVLQLTHADSAVLVAFKSGPPYEAFNNTDNASAGVNLFQFADGTVLTRDQLIAQATLQPNDFDPTVSALNPAVTADASIAASSLFSASDTGNNPITWYQITDSGDGGAHFVLNDKVFPAGQSFMVTAAQLSQLQYVAGSAGVADQITVSAFDQAVWSAPQSFTVTPTEAVGTTYQYDSLGRVISSDTLNADGSTSTATYSYSADGSYTDTVVATPSGAGGSTTTVYGYDGRSHLLSENVTNPDSSTARYTFDVQGQITSADVTNADGSTSTSAYSYNADGTYTDTVVATPSGGGGSTTTVYGYDGQSHLLSEDVTNPDSSTARYTFDVQGQITSADVTNADGSTSDSTYSYNADGSYTDSVVTTPAGGGGSTTTAYGYDAQGHLLSEDITSPDSSTANYTFNAQAQITSADVTHADGSTSDSTYTYNADSSYTDSVVTTPAGGDGSTTTAYGYDGQGHLLSENVTSADGSTASYTFNLQGQITSTNVTNGTGPTSHSTYSYNADGSYSDTVVTTPAGGESTTTVYGYDAQSHLLTEDVQNPDSSTADYVFNAQGQITSATITNADGSASDSTYRYNADGSYTDTVATTPAGGSSTATVYGYDPQGHLLSEDVTNPDASTANYTFSTQGQVTSADVMSADGSTSDSTYSYNVDGSYTDTVLATPANGEGSTTTVYAYDTQGQLSNENSYQLSADSSYTDSWSKQDGSYGTYGWDTSSREYQETWHDSNGSYWTDDYQYAAGGSPGATGYSFTETYSASDGSQGSRQFDATTGITSVTWDSSATGSLSGTISDAGFVGLQGNEELSNTWSDLTFFNPNVSPGFHDFLTAHA